MYIEWDEKYSVGVEKLDEQHKQLFALINKLHDAMKQGKSKETLNIVLHDLVGYVILHFEEEEGEMRAVDYPHLQDHIKQHQELAEEVRVLATDHDEGKVVLTAHVMGFLVDWLTNHIGKTDMKYRPYLGDGG